MHFGTHSAISARRSILGDLSVGSGGRRQLQAPAKFPHTRHGAIQPALTGENSIGETSQWSN